MKLISFLIYFLRINKLMAIESTYFDSDPPEQKEKHTPPGTDLDAVRAEFSINNPDKNAVKIHGDLDEEGKIDDKQTSINANADNTSDVELEENVVDGGDKEQTFKMDGNEYTPAEMKIIVVNGTKENYKVGEKTYKKAEFLELLDGKNPEVDDKNDDNKTDAEKTDTAAKDEEILKIGKKDYTQAEIEAGAKEYYKGVNWDTLPDEDKNKLINSHIDNLSRDQANKFHNKNAKKVSEREKAADAKDELLTAKETEINARTEELQDLITKAKWEIEKRDEILRQKPTDELDEREVTKLEIKQDQAKIEKAQLIDIKDGYENDHENIIIQKQIDEVVEAFPFMETEKHPYEILKAYDNGKITDKVELKKAQAIRDALIAYRENNSAVKFAEFFDIEFLDNIPEYIKGEATKKTDDKKGDKKTKKVIDLTGLTFDQRMKHLNKKQKENPGLPKQTEEKTETSSQGTEKAPVLKRPTLQDTGWN